MVHDVYSAVGNKVRAQLLLCLSRSPKNVTEMIHTCGLSQSAVSQHLRKLKVAGLVSTKKSGKEMMYSIKYKKAADIARLLTILQQEVV
ncbi:MAG: metalloregulator ArsR/SmtB family transcription factor [Microgenomates group bacterium]